MASDAERRERRHCGTSDLSGDETGERRIRSVEALGAVLAGRPGTRVEGLPCRLKERSSHICEKSQSPIAASINPHTRPSRLCHFGEPFKPTALD